MRFMKKFRSSDGGSVMAITAIMLPLVAAAAGGAIDFGNAMSRDTDLQQALDAAALAAARSTGDDAERKDLAQAMFEENFDTCNNDIDTVLGDGFVEVSATCDVQTVMLQIVGMPTIEIDGFAKAGFAEATSSAAAPFDACVLTLVESGRGININGTTDITTDCGWHSNSINSRAFGYNGTGTFRVPTFSAVGGVGGISLGGFYVEVIENAAPMIDPLSAMPPPPEAAGGCDYDDFSTNGTAPVFARPGVYCGGLGTNGTGNVTLDPGTYVMREGDFTINGTGNLVGEDVLIYLEPGASFVFNGTGSIQISALGKGSHAGMVLMQAYDEKNEVESAIFNMTDSSYVEGTVYLPRHDFVMNGTSNTNYAAKYTKLIVHELTRNGEGSFKMGSDYTGRAPLPEGLKTSQTSKRVVRLMQ